MVRGMELGDEGTGATGRGSEEGRVRLPVSEALRSETQGQCREEQKGTEQRPRHCGRRGAGRALELGAEALLGAWAGVLWGPGPPLGVFVPMAGTQHFRGASAALPGALAAW